MENYERTNGSPTMGMGNCAEIGLEDLNDDCLLELFNFLSPLDLCALRETSQRFQQPVHYYFELVYLCKERELILSKNLAAENVLKILTHSGKFVRNLIVYFSLDHYWTNDRILDLIADNCSDNLKVLRLNEVYFHKYGMSRFIEVLKNIEIIEMNHCWSVFDCFEEFMSYCTNLKEITHRCSDYVYTDYSNFLLQNDYQHLEALTLADVQGVTAEMLSTFFTRNRNLKSFKCTNMDDPVDSLLLPVIAAYAVHLEELCIELNSFSEHFVTHLTSLCQLEKLKRLEFNCDEISITSLVNELAKTNILESFGVSDIVLSDDFCDALCKLTNLKVLKFVSKNRDYDNYARVLSQKLINLEELHLVQCDDISAKEILAFVQNAIKLKKLYLFDCSYFDWRANDDFFQFKNDFVQLFKTRSRYADLPPINIYFNNKKFASIEEHLTIDEFEWCAKNGIVNLTLIGENIVRDLVGFYAYSARI